MKQIIPLPPSKVERLLYIVAIAITLICAATQVIGLRMGSWRLLGLTDFFGLDTERSFPTWYASILWFLVFGVAWKVVLQAREHKSFVVHWTVLSGLFLVMSVDEVVGVHEQIGWALSGVIHAKGYLFFPFVIPGAILALVFALAYSVFLLRLPRKTAWGILGSGALFIFAVIGLECLAANWTYHHGGMESKKQSLTYFLLSDTEEFLEMVSALLMHRALSDYLNRRA